MDSSPEEVTLKREEGSQGAEAREVAPGETLVDEVVKVNLVVGDKEEDHEGDLAVIEVDPAVVEADPAVVEADLAEAGEKDDPKVN